MLASVSNPLVTFLKSTVRALLACPPHADLHNATKIMCPERGHFLQAWVERFT